MKIKQALQCILPEVLGHIVVKTNTYMKQSHGRRVIKCNNGAHLAHFLECFGNSSDKVTCVGMKGLLKRYESGIYPGFLQVFIKATYLYKVKRV